MAPFLFFACLAYNRLRPLKFNTAKRILGSNNDRPKDSWRGDVFADRYATAIFEEIPAADNPYLAERVNCRGYEQVELCKNAGFVDYLYLLLRGDLPSAPQSSLLNRALIAFSNPGVRHPATRAAVTAAVGKTVPSGVLPVALLVLGSERDGAESVSSAMRFLRKARRLEPDTEAADGSEYVFGLTAGSGDRHLDALCDTLNPLGEYPCLQWGRSHLQARRARGETIGWLYSGLVAATFTDLGIAPRYAPGLLQLMAAPGLLAQGMEHAHREPTVLPFLPDERCEIER